MKRRLAVAVMLSVGLLLISHLSALASSTGAPAAQERGPTLGLFQAILIALGYFWTNSAFSANLGFNVFRWPLAAGPIVGLIMGDVVTGTLLGASINLVFLGVISAGGSQPADPSLAGWLGTALAMSAGLGQQEAIAVAAPLGAIGLIGFYSRMNVDIAFVHRADEYAEKGDVDGVTRMNWVPGQIYVFLTTFIPVVILALAGSAALSSLFAAIDPYTGGPWSWIRNWFLVAGAILALVGIAINLNLILRIETIPYFLIGFTVSALTGGTVNLIAMGVLGSALAIIHVIFIRRQNVPAGNA